VERLANGTRHREAGRQSSRGIARISAVLDVEESWPHGRTPTAPNVRALVGKWRKKIRCGAPRIYGELSKIGMQVSQATMAKYMARPRTRPSPPWRTFLTNHLQQIDAADFFVVPTATYRLLFMLVILAHERRRRLHFWHHRRPVSRWEDEIVGRNHDVQG
jgi:hypothetical protein